MFKLGYIAATVCLCLASAPTTAHARDADVAQAQLNLLILGYDPGPVDGAMGGRTLSALEKFHAERGGSFDGTFGENDIDALYEVLGELPFNGSPPMLDANTGRTTQRREFDFVPEVDLASLYTPISSLDPSGLTRFLQSVENKAYCSSTQEPFPKAGQELKTYSSYREFETTGRRNLNPGVKWLEELSFAVQSNAAAAALGDRGAAQVLKVGLLAHAEAGSALHSASLADRNGKLIVDPDFAAGTIATQALLANYLLARDALELETEQQQQIEIWLQRLFETFPDSAMALNPGIRSISQEVGRLGRSMMLHALLINDVDQFNEGATVALTAASFVREDGSERLGASRGNRALFYQGTALMYAMETYLILHSQGVDAEAIMGPTVRRIADFWGRAWHDHSVLHPYARENESVFFGSDYRVQDRVEVSAGVDLFLAIAEDGESRERLLEARAQYPFRRQIGDIFVSTCLAQVLGNYEPPPSAVGGGGLGEVSSSAGLTVEEVQVSRMGSNDQFAEYLVTVYGTQIDGQSVDRLNIRIFADFVGSKDNIGNLELLRTVFIREGLTQESSKSADYSSCGHVATEIRGSSQQLRLHWGNESQQNSCVLAKMHEEDRALWSAIMVNFDTIITAAGSAGRADELRALYEYASR